MCQGSFGHASKSFQYVCGLKDACGAVTAAMGLHGIYFNEPGQVVAIDLVLPLMADGFEFGNRDKTQSRTYVNKQGVYKRHCGIVFKSTPAP